MKTGFNGILQQIYKILVHCDMTKIAANSTDEERYETNLFCAARVHSKQNHQLELQQEPFVRLAFHGSPSPESNERESLGATCSDWQCLSLSAKYA